MNVTRWMSRAAEGATPAEELVKLPGYRADNREDIAEAKKLLAEAGFPDGSGFPVMDLVAASVPGHSEVLAPFYSDQLRRGLNIEVKIRVVERALITQEYKKDFNVVLGTLFNSPAVSPAPMWSTCWKTGGSQNWSGYSNPQFDKVVDQLSEEMDVAKRAQLFRKGEELLDANPPQYHFGFTDHAAMWRNYVKGLALEQRPYREWGRMETVWLDR
jgi:oligopeptide transport system substrate-binding protein